MMPEEWPIAAPAAASPIEPARHARRDRLAVVRRDFFLDPDLRLSEQERASMTAMLDDLLINLADEIVAALPEPLHGIGVEGHEALIRSLWQGGALDRLNLVALLLRRADELRLSERRQRHGPAGRAPLIQRWIADADGDLAAGAMALVIARGRRRDRFGQGRLLFDDLPAEEAVALAYLVAAALRHPLPAHAEIDRSLSAAAETLLSRHDEGLRMDAQLAGLVRLLEHAGRLDDSVIEDAAADGEIALLSAMLARRAGVPEAMTWAHLCDSGEGRFALLARLAGLSRGTAARLLAELASLVGVADPAAELARFDRIGDQAIEDARGEWRLPPAYQAARAFLRG